MEIYLFVREHTLAFTDLLNLGLLRFYDPNCLKAIETLRGDSLLLTTKFRVF